MKKEQNESSIGKVLGGVIFFAVAAVLGWLACGMYMQHAKKAQAAQMAAMAAAQSQAVTVAVTNAVMMEYNLPEKYVAHVEAMAEVDLRPQVEGFIKTIDFKEGDFVKEGQLLYTLDDEKYQAAVGQAKADLAAAEAEERRAVRYNKRTQDADSRGVTQLERDNAFAGEEKAKAAVLQAKAMLITAEYNCRKAKIVAPFSGKIGKTNVHIGDLVSPSSAALAHLVRTDPVRVTFPMTDRQFTELAAAKKSSAGQAVRMRLMLPNGSEYDQNGSWDFDDNVMSKETATMAMRLTFPNPDRMLIPNEFVTLLTYYQVSPKYLCVPQQCVVTLAGGGTGVWIVKDDLTVEQRVVETREMFNGWIPVLSGVKEGERVVMSGIGKLGAGMKVAFAVPTGNDDIVEGYQPPIKE